MKRDNKKGKIKMTCPKWVEIPEDEYLQLQDAKAERDELRGLLNDCRDEFEYIRDHGEPMSVHIACTIQIAAIDAAKGGGDE